MSRQPGIGLGRIEKFAAATAAALRGERLGAWPGRLSIQGKSYPLMEGGLVAFQNAFLNAGGFAPLSLSPDDRHIVSMEAFADWGSRHSSERAEANRYWREVGKSGLKVPSEKF